ncbi:PH domain-containing protein [Virgibacillus sp. NKC19-16]|uniref:PH domain-containing protein n=1 Tax=Virgibacillus salidurans TaxID=2831673 RepID=UPI001F3CEC8D|nr:PH domain-containing protein [Virgibacillus sp. NKC19-16]UJL47040.1 PH domain-containing protein [Virgibacillus sp. NKC19-16]
MSEPKRLHPAAIIFNFIKGIREFIFVLIFGFITFRDQSFGYFILIVLLLALIIVAYSVISWYRYTYRVEEEELRIEYGIFIRKKRYISKNRIQSIDLTQGVIHRIFKLAKVQIETAGSGNGSEASLKAVKFTEAQTLRDELKNEDTQATELDPETEAETTNHPFYKISFKRLFVAGSTSGSIGVIFVLALGALEFERFIPDRFFDNAMSWVIGLSIMLIVGFALALLLFLWLLGIAGTMIKYGNFTITKYKDELFITRGLLEKKQITIPLGRIQAVGIQESVIRQPLGFVTVFAEVAGGSLDQGEDFSTVLFPIMKRDEVEEFLQEILPDYAEQPQDFNPLPKRALTFYLFRTMVPIILLGIAVMFLLPQFSWVIIILLIGGLYLGFLRYRAGGYYLKENRLMVRYRVLSKTTMLMYHKRIQAFEKTQHKIQKAKKLATLKLSIIGKLGTGKHYTIKELDEADLDQLSDWYSYRK